MQFYILHTCKHTPILLHLRLCFHIYDLDMFICMQIYIYICTYTKIIYSTFQWTCMFMNGMHKMLAMPDVTRTNQRRVILPAAGTIPAIIPGVCPDGSFGTGSGSTCQQIEFGGDCWAYCQTASGYEGLARQYRCELTGDVLELKSMVADLTCATVTATVTLTTTVIGRRLASLDPCSSTSVTQVSDTSGSCVL